MAVPENKISDASSSLPHPPYFQMICEAISALKERTGSSQQAISKFIEAKHRGSLSPNFNKLLSAQLKRFVKSGKLVKLKNSFKTAAPEKKTARKAVRRKPLDGVKTPDTLKKKKADVTAEGSASVPKKTKPLSQVKTPEALKKKTPAKSRISSRTLHKKR